MAEVREMTRKAPIFARSPIRASVIPSTKYSCAGSPERFCNGKTTIDAILGGSVGGVFLKNSRYTSPARSKTGRAKNRIQFFFNGWVRDGVVGGADVVY